MHARKVPEFKHMLRHKRIREIKHSDREDDHIGAQTNYLHHLLVKNKEDLFQLHIETTPI